MDNREYRVFQWAGYEGMNFSQELPSLGIAKGVAQAFDRFLRVRAMFSAPTTVRGF